MGRLETGSRCRRSERATLSAVMAGLVLGIHVKASRRQQRKTWMAGTWPAAGPAMTVEPRARTATLLASTVRAILKPRRTPKGIRQKGGRGGKLVRVADKGGRMSTRGHRNCVFSGRLDKRGVRAVVPSRAQRQRRKACSAVPPFPALIRLPGGRGSVGYLLDVGDGGATAGRSW